MPTIRTTLEPWREIVVSDAEYLYLLRQGLIYTGETPPARPAFNDEQYEELAAPDGLAITRILDSIGGSEEIVEGVLSSPSLGAALEAAVADELMPFDVRVAAAEAELAGRLSPTSLSNTFADALGDPSSDIAKAGKTTFFAPILVVPGGPVSIQEAIDMSAEMAVSSSLAICRPVILYGGRYSVTTQIKQPQYVKVVAAGQVIIEANVPGDSAWWFSPLASDPSDLGALGKERANVGHVVGGDGLIITNVGGSRTGRTGTEWGARSDLGGNRMMSRYTAANIVVTGFAIGQKINTFDHYIAHYYGFKLENNDVNIQVGATGATVHNSGENFNWTDCLISGATTGLLVRSPGFGLTFRGCSGDFCDNLIQFDVGYTDAHVDGGWQEALSYYNPGTGGIAKVSFTPALADEWPRLRITGWPRLVNKRAKQFRGSMRLNAELAVVSGGSGYPTTDHTLAATELCDENVAVERLSMFQTAYVQHVSRSYNWNRDPVVAAEADGTASSALVNYAVTSTSGGLTCAVEDDNPPYPGAKSLKFVFNSGSRYHRVATKAYMPVRPGNVVAVSLAVRRPAATTYLPTVTVGVTWYDSDKVAIGTRQTVQPPLPSGVTDAWFVPEYAGVFRAPAGAAYAIADWTLSTTLGDGVMEWQASAFSAYVQNV